MPESTEPAYISRSSVAILIPEGALPRRRSDSLRPTGAGDTARCPRPMIIGYDLPFAPVRRFSASRCRCSAVSHLRAPFPSTNAAVGLGNSKSLTQRATYPIIRSKGPLSKPTTAAQPRRREPLLMLRVFGRLPVTDSGAHSRAGVGKASGEETAGGVCAGSGVGLWGFSVDLGAGAPVWNRDDG